MTVLIDPPTWPAHGRGWSHLVSDVSLDELHAFAARIGLSQRAFDVDHYDVPQERYDGCVAAGAHPVSGRELLTRLDAAGLRVRQADKPARALELRRDRLRSAWWALGVELAVVGAETAIATDAGARAVIDAGAGVVTDAGARGVADGGVGAVTDAEVVAARGVPLSASRDTAAHVWATAGDDLLRRWSEPHRRYHDTLHLDDVLASLDVLAREGAVVTPAARAAAWFHDAVYAGAPGRDEAESAALASEVLSAAGVDAVVTARVHALILATTPGTELPPPAHPPAAQEPTVPDGSARPEVPATPEVSARPEASVRLDGSARLDASAHPHESACPDPELDALLDADLAVFASTPKRYAAYASAVRAEYARYDDATFAAGRLAVMGRYLHADPLYRTPQARARWDAMARANLAVEVQALRSALAT